MIDTQIDGHERHRRVVIALVGCAVLVVVAVTSVLLIGIRNVPDLPTLREQPDPPVTGRLALQTWDDEEGMCIDVEELDTGERRHAFCEGMPVAPFDQPMGVNWFNWNDDGQLLLASYEGEDIRLLTFDVDTLDVVSETTLPPDTRPPDRRQRADGSTLTAQWHEDGRATVYVNEPGGTRRTLYETRGPDGYAFWSAEWSSRGDYAIVRDSEDRWIVLRVEGGDPVPRILTTDADQVVWYQE